MFKVLTGEGYTYEKLWEISNQANRTEIITNPAYSQYVWLGAPIQNIVSDNWGLVIDMEERARWVAYMKVEDYNNLIDVIEGDGWNDPSNEN